ncbi:MAG: zinc ribbon domain-containing protein [Dehalococcoidia bacterium]|nr:zinc ribbon domain-containing protein [Dehalococcoidia bacterium]
MIGIKSLGISIPRYRLTREALAQAWGRRAARGERTVANFDEDSITMAVEATANCLEGMDRAAVGALLFASTTSPYSEKQASALIASAVDLGSDVVTADLGGSPRSATIAVRLAMDMVRSGSVKNVIVAAADCRLAEPGSDLEEQLGDGGAAVLIGQDDLALEVEAVQSSSDHIMDLWKRGSDPYIKVGDPRFNHVHGYLPNMARNIGALLDKTDSTLDSFSKVIVPSPDSRGYLGLGKQIGLRAGQLQDPLFDKVGNTGTAHPLLLLAFAAEEAKPGDKILLGSYGDGADALSLRATDRIEELKGGLQAQAYLDSRRPLSSYEKYLEFRGLLVGRNVPLAPFSSPSLIWREQKQDLRLYGVRCRSCGRVQYPQVRVCRGCRAKDQFEDFKLSRQGRVFTFQKDHYYPCPDSPLTMSDVDLEGGGRVLLQTTDTDPGSMAVGMPVDLCLRKYHEGGGFLNYYWKCRTPRRGYNVNQG